MAIGHGDSPSAVIEALRLSSEEAGPSRAGPRSLAARPSVRGTNEPEVEDLDTALVALAEIVEQGEGTTRSEVWDGDQDIFHPYRDEVAHYYRFVELKLGRRYRRGDTPQSGPTGETLAIDYRSVHPMRRNPRLTDHPVDSPIRAAQAEFNHTYCTLLRSLEQAFNGRPKMLGAAVGTMYTLKAQAQSLMQMPGGDDRTAGPTFEYLEPELRR
ncbi:ferritin-like domain-containing protein [Kribbella soli]|uniref:Iminophenyl-pyruvate dimer synthase domain-containing protein n=1 Tax=Kribbella soli TaxID=1124743 RepID=A0A4R0HHG1_9ACTN|nr:ferritin-like domain-containing protein [Kribbella soli]TCC07169.1 hypothetical protein E0H45_14200 [Kribbella soli]